MPIIRIGNYEVPIGYGTEFDDKTAHKEWQRDVRQVLWQAIAAIAVPGLERRESVTFTFDSERDELDTGREGSVDPCTAYILIEGFEDRQDRPVELRHRLATALGQALLDNLPEKEGWSVEVLPKHYNSEREGAVLVGARDPDSLLVAKAGPSVSGPDAAKSATPPLRYRFRVYISRGGDLAEMVFTAPYEFADWQELLKAVIDFGSQRWHLLEDGSVPDQDDVHPAFWTLLDEFQHGNVYTIEEAIDLR